MDMFGRDSDTTSDYDIDIGAQDGQPSTEAVESHPPPLAVGRALFARAVSDDTAAAARPVKTLPRPVYDGDKGALIKVCRSQGSGDVDEARDLIAQGINIDEQDNTPPWGDSSVHTDLSTALMYAAVYNYLEIVQELIRAGAALDLQDSEGRTTLMDAAWKNRLEIAQELIRAGAALDVQDSDGRNALQLARENGHTKIATLLREAGARCPGYERSGWFVSTCKRCGGSKVGRWHEEA